MVPVYGHRSYEAVDEEKQKADSLCKGTFIFYEVGGAGGIWGGHRKKKKALKGGTI